MMIMEDNSRRPPLEPVLPLINVVFLLLIFFMLAGQLAKRPTVAVDTPVSQVANGQEAREKLLLVLKPDGQWFAEDSDIPLTGETLATLIQDLPSVVSLVRCGTRCVGLAFRWIFRLGWWLLCLAVSPGEVCAVLNPRSLFIFFLRLL